MSRSGLMERLATHNALLTPVIRVMNGQIIKSIGDAFLLTFESPTDALHCALCIQHTLTIHNRDVSVSQQIHIKISVHCGEVSFTDNDVFGDPVNVAAKIEKATEPDQVYFTESVFLSMNQAEVPHEFVKTFAARGDTAPEVRLYRVLLNETDPRYQHIVSAYSAKSAAEQLRATTVLSSASEPLIAPLKNRTTIGISLVATTIAAASIVWWPTSPSVKEQTTLRVEVAPNSPIAPINPNIPLQPSAQSKHDVVTTARSDNRSEKQAASIALAASIIQEPRQLKEKSHAVIERLAADFGDNAANDKQVQALLLAALQSRIYWEARNASFEVAGSLLERYRNRFPWITEWHTIERERYLGGFHNYASDDKLRRQWRSVWHRQWNDQYAFLKAASDADPSFGLRFATEFNGINRQLFQTPSPAEQILVREAIQRQPSLLKTERSTVFALLQSWLQHEQDENSYARELARQTFYTELRPWLVKNVMANSTTSVDPTPAYSWRQNCVALLASKNDLDALGDVWAYIKNNTEVFMRASETVQWGDGTKRTQVFLSSEQMRRVLQRPMREEDQRALAQWLDRMLADISSGTGPWANENSRSVVLAMQEELRTLKRAQ